MVFGSKLTPAEKAAKEARKTRERAERNRARAAAEARRETERQERYEVMPTFVVRQVREIRVKASDIPDALALANVAFKDGVEEDGSLKWGRPWGVEGNTLDQIRIVNVKAQEEDD